MCKYNIKLHFILAGLLDRDSRVKERNKPGQKKARKQFQWYKLKLVACLCLRHK